MSRSLILAMAALPLALPAFAGTIDLASTIDRVTVFPDAAQVTRVARLDLPAGASTLVLRGLPAALDPASLRVEGEGAFVIGAVDSRAVPGEAKPVVDPALEARIEALRRSREEIESRIATAETKRAMIERYAQASPEKLSAEAKPLDIGQWAQAWETVAGGLAAVHKDLVDLRRREGDIAAEIAALERARPRPPRPGSPKRDVTIAVEASAPLAAGIAVTYRVAGASWTASYDARLDTGARGREPALELVRRADVVQRTGEDWTNVALAVSTVRVARNASPPDLPPLIADFAQARPLPAARMSSEAMDTVQGRGLAAAPPAPVAAEQAVAEMDAGAFQTTFTVAGRVDVTQDGGVKSLLLSRRSLAPALVVKAVPVLDPTAYLEAGFTHEEEAPLLPGTVALTRDGTFVGRARLALTPPGARVDLGFGADDRVKVERSPLRRSESEPGWIGNARTETTAFKTVVRNLHARPMRIAVIDRVPVPENTAITVETLRESTPPTQAQVNDKRGVSAWTYDYAPGETKEIRLAYRLRWPADKDLSLDPSPLPRPLR